MSAEYSITCDRCSSLIESSRVSATCARVSAINAGVMLRIGKQDICIHCAAQVDAALSPQETKGERQDG